jgi:hypothetical protein
MIRPLSHWDPGEPLAKAGKTRVIYSCSRLSKTDGMQTAVQECGRLGSEENAVDPRHPDVGPDLRSRGSAVPALVSLSVNPVRVSLDSVVP